MDHGVARHREVHVSRHDTRQHVGNGEDPLPSPGRPMSWQDVWKMSKRRGEAAGLPDDICNHSFRAAGITIDQQRGGYIQKAARAQKRPHHPALQLGGTRGLLNVNHKHPTRPHHATLRSRGQIDSQSRTGTRPVVAKDPFPRAPRHYGPLVSASVISLLVWALAVALNV